MKKRNTPPVENEQGIEAAMRAALGQLTPAERQLAAHILSHFPISALGSINALSRAAGVSSPTVVRLARKLGYSGYSDYQSALREELTRILVAPVSRGPRPGGGAVAEPHILHRFVGAMIANLEAVTSSISLTNFDRVAALLADPKRHVLVHGGRLTQAHAVYFATLLGVVRSAVSLMSGPSQLWQQSMIDVRPGDVIVLFDIRRYERMVTVLASFAAEKQAEVVLITDRWLSPAAKYAKHVLACHIEIKGAWDSTVSITAVLEALVASVQGLNWQDAETRLEQLEDYFAHTDLFRGAT